MTTAAAPETAPKKEDPTATKRTDCSETGWKRCFKWFRKHQWATLFTLVLTAAGVGLTWLQTCSGTLTYGLKKNDCVLVLEDGHPNLQYDCLIRFENTGFKPINLDSFNDSFAPYGKGLLLKSSNKDCKVIAFAIAEMRPAQRNIAEVVPSEDKRAIFIKPLALNWRDGFSLRIIYSSNPGPISLWGHLSNCQIQKLVENQKWNDVLSIAWNCFLFVGASLGIVSFLGLLYCFCFAKALWDLTWKGVAYVIKGIGSLGSDISMWSKAYKSASSPEKVMEIILCEVKFSEFAKDIGADSPAKERKVREYLAKKIKAESRIVIEGGKVKPENKDSDIILDSLSVQQPLAEEVATRD